MLQYGDPNRTSIGRRQYSDNSNFTPDTWGGKHFEIQGSNGSDASVANFTLPAGGGNGLWVMHACCDWSTGPNPRAHFNNTALVIRSDLQARAVSPIALPCIPFSTNAFNDCLHILQLYFTA